MWFHMQGSPMVYMGSDNEITQDFADIWQNFLSHRLKFYGLLKNVLDKMVMKRLNLLSVRLSLNSLYLWYKY